MPDGSTRNDLAPNDLAPNDQAPQGARAPDMTGPVTNPAAGGTSSPTKTFTSNLRGRAYRVLEVVGKGGFGTVYRGQVEGGQGFVKQVAIKVLNPDTDEDSEFGRRLRDEARVLGLLNHRAIVQVDDLARIDDQWAVVMEWVPGCDVAELIERGPLPPRVAAEIVLEAASALQMAHQATDPQTGQPLELVHRDIKPANIRVTPRGEVKVLDFGVARARFDQRESETRSLAFGSLGYLAPERFEFIEVPASDIYALGIVLLRSLSGEQLKQLSPNPDRHRDGIRQALDGLQGVPRTLQDLISKMMAYSVEDRPTAGNIARQIREVLATLPGPWLADWALENIGQGAPEGAGAAVEQPPAGPGPNSQDTLQRPGSAVLDAVTDAAAGPAAQAPTPREAQAPSAPKAQAPTQQKARAPSPPKQPAPGPPRATPEPTSSRVLQSRPPPQDRPGTGIGPVLFLFGAFGLIVVGGQLLGFWTIADFSSIQATFERLLGTQGR